MVSDPQLNNLTRVDVEWALRDGTEHVCDQTYSNTPWTSFCPSAKSYTKQAFLQAFCEKKKKKNSTLQKF